MYRYITTAIVIISTLGGFAQQTLSLQQCREMALGQNENIEIARLQHEKAKTDRAAMKTQYFPSLSGSATGAYLFNDIEMEMHIPTAKPNPLTGELEPNIKINPNTGDPVMGPDGNPVFNVYGWLPLEISLKGAYMAGVRLEQPIYTGGKIQAGNRMAKIGIEMTRENLKLEREKTIYNTDQSYWLYVTVQEKVKLAQEYQKLLEELLTTTQDAHESGMSTQNDVLKVKVKLNKAKLELQKAQSGLKLTRMALCRTIGLPFEAEIVTTDSLNNTLKPVNPGNVKEVSFRPEYSLLEKQIELATEKKKLARADFLPSAGLQVGYNYIGGIKYAEQRYNDGNTSIMASLKIPLFHWGEGVQKIKSAQHEVDIKKAKLKKNSRLLELEITQAKLNLNDAITRVEMAKESLAQADENVRVTNDNYELGMKILPELLEAQAQWQEAY
ncbi:MAG TPA: TolC family protein, partial [Prolixibacteraceae bacterium]|nr:TolC family protein [Prolixibacteraceae bacterium]